MSERMIITDVARMHSGACIAGYSTDLGRPIRPVLPAGGGLNWPDLCVAKGALLAPFSVVNINLADARPDPPHCEDVVVNDPVTVTYIGKVPERKIPVALEKLAFDSVLDAFDRSVIDGRSIAPGAGSRSLATIRFSSVDYLDFQVSPDDQSLRFRVSFRDGSGERYSLPVTDIGYRTFCYHLLATRREFPRRMGARMRERLNKSDCCFIRVGASRPFAPSPDREERCYLLATGIYSVPDYRELPWETLFPGTVPEDDHVLPEEVVRLFET